MQRRQRRARAEELEALLDSAQRAATTGLLAAGVSHDVANHLLVVLGNAALLLAEHAEDERLHDIVRSAERAAELNRSLLRVGRRRDDPCAPLDVEEVLAELQPLLVSLAGAGVRLEVEIGERLAPVAVDRYALESTLVNLVANAREALHRHGHVRISARAAERGVLIEVEDDGPGIPADALPHIFEPFFGLKAGGSGIGLAVSRSLLHGYHATITAANRACGGAVFSVLLPHPAS